MNRLKLLLEFFLKCKFNRSSYCQVKGTEDKMYFPVKFEYGTDAKKMIYFSFSGYKFYKKDGEYFMVSGKIVYQLLPIERKTQVKMFLPALKK